MIKSTAGGGGIGMSRCDDEASLRTAFATSVRLASASFGNGAVYVEKYILSPRHIEIQVFGDGEKVICLGERECSVQRRNQKVIEETPSPFVTPAMRAAMAHGFLR